MCLILIRTFMMETVFVSGINRIRKIEAELLITQKQNYRNTYKIIFF